MNYNNYNWQNSFGYSQFPNSTPYPNSFNQPNTNKIYVTSLEDALNRSAPRGSEMVYFHQDANEFYVVKTDSDGRKSWAGFNYVAPNPDLTTPATKADIKELLDRIVKLEGGSNNAEPNG